MRRSQKLGKRAVALALAASMMFSALPAVWAAEPVQDEHDHIHLEHEHDHDHLEDQADEELEDKTPDSEETDPEEPDTEPTDPENPDPEEPDTEPTDPENPDPEEPGTEPTDPENPGTEQPDAGVPDTGDIDILVPTDGYEIDTYAAPYCDGPHVYNGDRIDSTIKEATCTEPGIALMRCSNDWQKTIPNPFGKPITSTGWCEARSEQPVPALNHSYGEWETVTKAYCGVAGQKKRTCIRVVNGAVCGHVDYAEIPALEGEHEFEHVVKPATCTEDGKEYDVCTKDECGYIENEVVLPATGHTQGEQTDHKDPTCVDEGYDEYLCTVCNKTYREVIPATGHTAGEVVERVEPKCEEAGSVTAICEVCGVEFTEAIEPLGHEFLDENYVDDNQPGCQTQTETAKCTRCDVTNTRETGAPIRPHKFTSYYVVHKIQVPGLGAAGWLTYAAKASCDYGCGTEDFIGYDVDETTALADAIANGEKSKAYQGFLQYTEWSAKKETAQAGANEVDKEINDALIETRDAVNASQTKEEALEQLNIIYDRTREKLVALGVANPDEQLASLKGTIKTLQDSLNNDFISLDTIKVSVTGVVNATVASGATKQGIYDLVFGALNNDNNTDPAVQKMTLSLARDALKGDQMGWDALTKTLLNDALGLAADKIKAKPYGPFIPDDLLAEMMDEMRELAYKEVDQATVDRVKSVMITALDNAIEGLDKGWSNEKILANARNDLNALAPVLSQEIDRIGAAAAPKINESVSDKINRMIGLGWLTQWIGDEIGNLAERETNRELEAISRDVSSTLDALIKYITCPGHDYSNWVQGKAPTCEKAGWDYAQCTECGHVDTGKSRTVAALGHAPVTDEAYEPTETMSGRTEGSHCARCGLVFVAQETIPALMPTVEAYVVRADITPEAVETAGYETDADFEQAINNALVAAGYDPANSERFHAQVQSSIGILPDDRFPAGGLTLKLAYPEQTAGQPMQYYAVQVYTSDANGHKAGDLVELPLTQREDHLELTMHAGALVGIAWKAQ